MSANSINEIKELCNKNIFLKCERNKDCNSKDQNIGQCKFLIKFNDSLIISNEEISNYKIHEESIKISSGVVGFDIYKNQFMNNSRLEPYLCKLLIKK